MFKHKFFKTINTLLNSNTVKPSKWQTANFVSCHQNEMGANNINNTIFVVNVHKTKIYGLKIILWLLNATTPWVKKNKTPNSWP